MNRQLAQAVFLSFHSFRFENTRQATAIGALI
jgi:hypothetical protein